MSFAAIPNSSCTSFADWECPPISSSSRVGDIAVAFSGKAFSSASASPSRSSPPCPRRRPPIFHEDDCDHPFANRSLELRPITRDSTLRPRPVRKPADEGNDIGRLPNLGPARTRLVRSEGPPGNGGTGRREGLGGGRRRG